ncbi:MAG: DNA repair protein RecO C-terminal domain-containing protein [Bacteroidaceae bacterium]|jgi:DNA repair protein RecO (recombination protein O)|nr:DNA repair protein RecO C-terminal domain-containing protein [Bacteroidaceae bacterium]
MFIKSRAIVLHTLKYNDTSFVAVLFSEEVGEVSFMVRIPKSRRAGGRNKLFQPLNILDIGWERHEKSSLQHLHQVGCHYPYVSIPYHPLKSAIALFVSEFLYYSLRGERSGGTLFNYIFSSLQWLDLAPDSFSNFHLVFLMRLSRFLGFFPNTEHYMRNDFFDLQNSCFTSAMPPHPYYISPSESQFIPLLMRMNYETMHLFVFSREQRNRLLVVLNEYFRLHIPNFPKLKSLDVLREVFD